MRIRACALNNSAALKSFSFTFPTIRKEKYREDMSREVNFSSYVIITLTLNKN